MRKIIYALILLFLVFNSLTIFAQKTIEESKPQTLVELKDAIRKILKETNTPGTGIVLVSGNQSVDFELGKADIDNNIDVD